jgi:hypothetical protein
MPADFFAFLSASVDLLKADSPENFSKLTSEMNGLRATISTTDARKCVYFEGDCLALDEAHPHSTEPDIEVALTDRAVLDLLDGKCSLKQSVIRGEIHVRANPLILDRYHRCLGHYLNGALRSASFPTLLSQYRSAVSSSG